MARPVLLQGAGVPRVEDYLKSVVQVGYGAVAADQKPSPDGRVNLPRHNVRPLDLTGLPVPVMGSQD